MEQIYKQEIFFEEEGANKFINRLQDSGKRYTVSRENYFDECGALPCVAIVIDYED